MMSKERPMEAQSPHCRPPSIGSFKELRSYIHEDYRANGRSFWSPGFQALVAYRVGVWRNSVRFRPARMLLTLFCQPLAWISRAVYGIQLKPRTRIGRRLFIAHQHGIVIHGRAAIGDDCVIHQGVTIGAARSGPQSPPILGDRVMVGAGAVIVGSVVVGDDVSIGPNAVVLTNVPSGSVVAAPPARILTPPPRRRTVTPPPAAAPASDPAGPQGADTTEDREPLQEAARRPLEGSA